MSRLTAVCVLGFCVLAAAAPGAAGSARELPGLAPAPRDALTRALENGRLTPAEYALERGRTLFELRQVRGEYGTVAAPGPHDATRILRDLALRRDRLRGQDHARASRVLRRPAADEAATECDVSRNLCFHRVTNTNSRHFTSNTQFNATIATFQEVWDLEVEQYGYAPPLGDAGQGGSDDTDIYVRDLGGNDNPLFGYCTTDDPAAGSSPFTDVWAYCVVDNDFSRRQFPCCETPQNFRAVTAAHEFFHAIQFHYDVREDLWLMEGTAMLMEGQFRPTVDDRIRYLDNSVLTFPRTSVDFGTNGFEYGAWIYWRFLVERFAELANPLVIRQVWERAAGSSTDMDGIGPDTRESNLYSLAATRAVLAAREPGTTFRALFARFASVNRSPSSFYIEGADYPHAAAASVRRLREGESTGWRTTKLWHLASTSYAFKRRPSLPADATIRFVVNLPEPRHGAVATLLIRRADGVVAMRTIALDGGGRGSRAVALVSSVRRVDLVLTNASTRMQCWEATPYSCSGSGSDDRRSYRYRVTVR